MEEIALVLRRVADASAGPGKPSRPALVLSHRTWDGARYDRRRQTLFLPRLFSTVRGEEFTIQLIGASVPWVCKATVGDLLEPGREAPGSPAGVVMQLVEPDPALIAALENRAARSQRSAPRFPVNAPVVVRPEQRAARPVASIEYATDEELVADYVSNLSQGCAFVRTGRPLPVGSAVQLAIRLPGGTVLEAPATVVHTSAAGMGVRFSLARAGEEKLGEIIAQISARQRHALIVDDDALSRRTIADALAERGFEVFAAGDGESGLRVLTDHLLALDLVVADVRMPRMDGEVFLRTVRGVGGEQDLAVVMVSGSLGPEIEARLHREGADAVLDKALGPEMIAQASDAALARKRLERAST